MSGVWMDEMVTLLILGWYIYSSFLFRPTLLFQHAVSTLSTPSSPVVTWEMEAGVLLLVVICHQTCQVITRVRS